MHRQEKVRQVQDRHGKDDVRDSRLQRQGRPLDYVLDTEGQQYAFAYDQIKTHFSTSVKERARQATAAPPKGKAPTRAAPAGRKRRRAN